MPPTTRSIFRSSALRSGLITQDQLERVESAIRAGQGLSGSDVSDEQLARKLVELDVLTSYQADQLREGRTKLTLGPYIITDWIGQGGMGQVFKAVHEMMGRESAVKVLPLTKATPEAIVSFTREIRTQAQLDHPNLVRAFDAGHDGNVYYLVTEFVPGTDLRRLVRSRGPLGMQQAASIIVQAARGLEYAHQRGLIHRDIKPGNVLVTPTGVAKVSDLGLAGFMHLAEDDPRAGKIVGTADYLSPEQIRTPLEITPSSDVYSLGCTLYYAVTGKVPYPGGSTSEKARRHCEPTAIPWHPKRFNPEISEEFVEVIADMMEKDPKQRIQTTLEVIARLEPWAAEAMPIPSQQLTKMAWMAPPLPTEQLEELKDTDDDLYYAELDSSRAESGSQWSQGTETLQAAETLQIRGNRRRRRKPPLTLSGFNYYSTSRDQTLLIWLAVSVSLLVGVLLGFMARSMML